VLNLSLIGYFFYAASLNEFLYFYLKPASYQQAVTQSQSLSQLYGNPPEPTYAEVSAARSKNVIFKI